MSVQQFEKNKIAAPFLGEPLVHIVGQDPLGLLNTGGKTFDLVLPGINNVTDRIRYYSFYCWFFHSYAKYISKPSKKEQFDHLRRAEFILSLLAARTGVQGIGGITGKNGQIDHLIPVQIDHLFRLKLTTQFRSKLTT